MSKKSQELPRLLAQEALSENRHCKGARRGPELAVGIPSAPKEHRQPEA